MSAYLQWGDARGDTVWLDIDAAKVVTYERAAEVTEHPVEGGSPIADQLPKPRMAPSPWKGDLQHAREIPRTHTRGPPARWPTWTCAAAARSSAYSFSSGAAR